LALRHRKGRPGELRDTMIAGIVLASASGKITGCILSEARTSACKNNNFSVDIRAHRVPLCGFS
jgi:hypothetical protein